MIKNVVFDLGRVLVEYDPITYLREMGYEEEQTMRIAHATFLGPVWLELDRGTYNFAEAIEVMAANNPDLADDIRAALDPKWRDIMREMPETSKFLRQIKSEGYKIYFLSNFSVEGFEYIAQKFSVLDEADGRVVSGYLHTIKPEPQIYTHLLNKFQLNPAETVFIDDLQENLAAAEKQGIHTILFTTLDEVIRRFREMENHSEMTKKYPPASLANYIDHTLLKSDASVADVKKICDEAKQYHFASVCVNPSYINLVAKELEGSGVTPCCVIGFPFGTQTPVAKRAEAEDAVLNGAKELDMVINVGAIKSGDWDLVTQDVEAVVKAAAGSTTGKVGVKVILETCLLTDEEKVKSCTICKQVGADFVKTSTGYSTGGATAHDVALMRKTVGADVGVKASGGIRTYEDACTMIEAGANRIGASAGIKIIAGSSGNAAAGGY